MKVKSTRFHSTLALALAMTPTLVFAQGRADTGGFDNGDRAKAWSSFHLDKKKKIRVNFKNAGVDSVIQFFMDQSGITIIRDPSFKDPLTIGSATSVTLDKAFDIFNTIIGLKGFQMVQQDGNLVIKPKDQGFSGFGGGGGGNNIFNGGGGGDNPNGGQSQSVLRTYKINYASASEVAKVINDVFAAIPGQQNNNPFARFQQFGGGNNGFGGGNNRGNRFGGGNQPFQGLNINNFQTGQQTVKASSDDYSNTVIVNATDHDQDQVRQIINQIDKQTDTPVIPKVFKLQYASATDIASIVQNVLTQNQPKGRGAAQSSGQNLGAQFGLAFARGGAAAFGNVVADTRSNSLVVSTTVENLALVDQVIADLDKPVDIQETTFVFQLQNAHADTVANLLLGAYGNRQGASGGGTNVLNQNSRQTINTPLVNKSSVGSTSSSSASRPGAENLNNDSQDAFALSEDQKNLLVALQDPNADSGELLTSVAVTQGGFGGGGGRGGGGGFGGLGSAQTTGNSLGYVQTTDSQNRVVNTHDLTGQITVIPDINTNSLIVVGPPSSVPVLKQILAQLDKVQEQVQIDVIIVEASLTTANQFGLEWTTVQHNVGGNNNTSGTGKQNFGLQSSTTPLQGFSYTLAGNDLSAFFNVLQTDTKVDVLGPPKILTTNGVQASINVSQSIPYVLSTVQDATTGALSYTYGFENVGIVLTVTPRITAGDVVQLDIDQQANSLVSYTSFNAPIVDQREATSEVQIQDGKTVILGGLISNQVSTTTNKIPLLGDLPLLGNLFRSTSKSVDKTELLIFLTPHLVKSPADADRITQKVIDEVTPRTKKTVHDITTTGSVFGTDSAGNKKPATPPPSNNDSHGTGNGQGSTTSGGN